MTRAAAGSTIPAAAFFVRCFLKHPTIIRIRIRPGRNYFTFFLAASGTTLLIDAVSAIFRIHPSEFWIYSLRRCCNINFSYPPKRITTSFACPNLTPSLSSPAVCSLYDSQFTDFYA
jgi:hypothetical protein